MKAKKKPNRATPAQIAQTTADRQNAFKEYHQQGELSRALNDAKPLPPEADNHLLIIRALEAIHELRRRASKGDYEAALHLTMTATAGVVQLHRLIRENEHIAKAALTISPKLPINAHRSWMKDGHKPTLDLIDRLEVGHGAQTSHLRMPASQADTPAKQWAVAIIDRINKARLRLPLMKQLSPDMSLGEIEKVMLALPPLTRDTAYQWFECGKAILPDNIYEAPGWEAVNDDSGPNGTNFPHPANKRSTIHSQIRQAIKTIAAE